MDYQKQVPSGVPCFACDTTGKTGDGFGDVTACQYCEGEGEIEGYWAWLNGVDVDEEVLRNSILRLHDENKRLKQSPLGQRVKVTRGVLTGETGTVLDTTYRVAMDRGGPVDGCLLKSYELEPEEK